MGLTQDKAEMAHGDTAVRSRSHHVEIDALKIVGGGVRQSVLDWGVLGAPLCTAHPD